MNVRISKNDALILKGVGILMIIFHNFFHLVEPLGGENEFSFKQQYLTNFIFNIVSDPSNLVQYLSTFLGHYGVQLFILCSGYGLTIVYGNRSIGFNSFIKKRLLKLYPTFTIAIILLLIYQYVIFDKEFTIRTLGSVFVRYTLIANWIPGKIFTLSGPYWYYSMIVQLYLLFPLFIVFHKKYKHSLWVIVLVSYIIIFFANTYFSSINMSLYYNFLGNIPVFVFGMILAFNKEWYFKKWMWALSALLFTVGQLNVHLWYFSQIAFVLVALPFILKLYNSFPDSIISKFLAFSGRLSMYLFAINGFMRVPWVELSNGSPSRIYTYMYGLLYITLVFLVAFFVLKVEGYLMNGRTKFWVKIK